MTELNYVERLGDAYRLRGTRVSLDSVERLDPAVDFQAAAA